VHIGPGQRRAVLYRTADLEAWLAQQAEQQQGGQQ
jgi:hypothetical protein